jgi:hypothetical protein
VCNTSVGKHNLIRSFRKQKYKLGFGITSTTTYYLLASTMSNNCHYFTTTKIQEKLFQKCIGLAFVFAVDLRCVGYQKEAIISSPTDVFLLFFLLS